MKVIFLDIDGVLLTTDSFRKSRENGGIPPQSCVTALNKITDTTGAKIVISSSWRFLGLPRIKRRFNAWGITSDVISTTSDLSHRLPSGLWTSPQRCEEIIHWINNAVGDGLVESYIAIDDDDYDMSAVKDRLIKTNIDDGLTDELAQKAIEMLDN